MSTTLNSVLDQRQHRVSSGQQRSYYAASAVGHALLAGLFLLMPALLAEEPESFDYVAVTVVPPKALGTEDPTPPPPPEPAPQKPAPPPPPPPEPEKKAEPEVDDRPVLVEKKTPKPPPPKPPPPKPPPKQATPPAPPASPIAKRQGSPFGDPLGTSTNAAVVGVEDPNFTYGYYLDLVVSRIIESWTRPVVGGDVKDAILHFRIEKDGTVKDLELRQRSGDETFDQAALRAVRAASPLPPLPKGYKRDYLGINVVVK